MTPQSVSSHKAHCSFRPAGLLTESQRREERHRQLLAKRVRADADDVSNAGADERPAKRPSPPRPAAAPIDVSNDNDDSLSGDEEILEQGTVVLPTAAAASPAWINNLGPDVFGTRLAAIATSLGDMTQSLVHSGTDADVEAARELLARGDGYLEQAVLVRGAAVASVCAAVAIQWQRARMAMRDVKRCDDETARKPAARAIAAMGAMLSVANQTDVTDDAAAIERFAALLEATTAQVRAMPAAAQAMSDERRRHALALARANQLYGAYEGHARASIDALVLFIGAATAAGAPPIMTMVLRQRAIVALEWCQHALTHGHTPANMMRHPLMPTDALPACIACHATPVLPVATIIDCEADKGAHGYCMACLEDRLAPIAAVANGTPSLKEILIAATKEPLAARCHVCDQNQQREVPLMDDNDDDEFSSLGSIMDDIMPM